MASANKRRFQSTDVQGRRNLLVGDVARQTHEAQYLPRLSLDQQLPNTRVSTSSCGKEERVGARSSLIAIRRGTYGVLGGQGKKTRTLHRSTASRGVLALISLQFESFSRLPLSELA